MMDFIKSYIKVNLQARSVPAILLPKTSCFFNSNCYNEVRIIRK